jgi:hypothetical protein
MLIKPEALGLALQIARKKKNARRAMLCEFVNENGDENTMSTRQHTRVKRDL